MMLLDALTEGFARPFAPDAEDGDYSLNPGSRDVLCRQNLRDAAVLIAIVQNPAAPGVILTRRSAHLRQHSAQIAFPGGAVDPSDGSAADAALREAEEEIGLSRHVPHIIGQLPDYVSGSGFRIKPVVALVPCVHTLTINTHEVEEAFEVPLAFLMDPANHIRASREWQGVERFYYEIPYDRHHIWGVTAGIVRALYERVLA
jgi:8-oxo-dGTP pyrophosphatase MutT (NUDIX family)